MPPPTKENILDLPMRRTIVDAVATTPGVHLRALAQQLDVAVSTLEYHCYQLVRTGHLNTRETAGFKAFYPAEGMDRRDKDLLYVLRQEAPRRICTHLLLHPGATPKDLKSVLGLSGGTLSFHLTKLRKADLLHEVASGRTKLLSILDDERVANVLVTYKRSFVDDAVDRFASAWLDLHPPRRRSKPGDGVAAGVPGTAAAKGPLEKGEPMETADEGAPTGMDPASVHAEATQAPDEGGADGRDEGSTREATEAVDVGDALRAKNEGAAPEPVDPDQ